MEEKFTKFGKIIQKGIYRDKRTKKFYAFVAFDKASDALNAKEEMNGYKEGELSEEPLYVDVA